ncbi:CTSL2 protein, partial [Edolisoma coerulescens]|nr:CTSL2 protein [Edolisoma coerulescens]
FIYTTVKQDYAKKLLEVLDPKKKLIRCRCWRCPAGDPLCDRAGSPRLCLPPSRRCLSQSDCVCSQGCYWKDLTRLGRDLATTVALDLTMQGFPAHAANWIPVPRWTGDPQDQELLRLIPVLAELGRA